MTPLNNLQATVRGSGSNRECHLCKSGHRLSGINHIPSQSIGMIPILRCLKHVTRKDIKRFRLWLNFQDAGETRHREGRFRQRTRAYGDYLYYQDRDRFMAELIEWLPKQKASK